MRDTAVMGVARDRQEAWQLVGETVTELAWVWGPLQLLAWLAGPACLPAWQLLLTSLGGDQNAHQVYVLGSVAVLLTVYWVPALLYTVSDLCRPALLWRYKVQAGTKQGDCSVSDIVLGCSRSRSS